MKPPTNLKGEARKFFMRHADRCEDEGTLTEATLDSFILLCRTWDLLAKLDPDTEPKTGVIKYVALSKTFERQAVQFGITNKKKAEKKSDINDILKKALGDDA